MNLVKLTVMWVSENNNKFAILAPMKSAKFGNRVIVTRGQGGFLESDTPWTKGESIEVPEGSYKITYRKTKLGNELPCIELV